MQWTGTWHRKTWWRRWYATSTAANAWFIGVNPVLTLQLWKNFFVRNSMNMKMMRNLSTVSGTRAIFTTFTVTCDEYKKTLIDVIDDLTKYSYIEKLKITSSLYRTKSKAATGVMNTESYILWLNTTWDQMVASNMIHCVLGLMTTTITQTFCIKFKHCLFIILKLMAQI